MNATKNASVAPVYAVNPNNTWRIEKTQEAINALMSDKEPDMSSFESFPWNDKDDDRTEKSFSLSSLKRTVDYLNRDDRDVQEMTTRLQWLEEAPGKMKWMVEKYNQSLGKYLQKYIDAFKAAAKAFVENKSKIAETVSKLALDKEQATAALTEAKAFVAQSRTILMSGKLSDMYVNKALRQDVVEPEFLLKIKGLNKRLSQVFVGEYEKLAHDVALILSKRNLAGRIQGIIAAREETAKLKSYVEAELSQILDDVAAPVVPVAVEAVIPSPVVRKVKSHVKVAAKSRKEITASLENLADAIVHKAVQDVSERRISKSEAIELLNIPEELFEEAVVNAINANEEEVLSCAGVNPGVVLVRKVGAVRRFFVKQASAETVSA